MHIIQILPELSQGGVERYVTELNGELVRLGHTCTVISAGGSLTKQVEQCGGRHMTLNVYSKNPLTVPKRVLELRQLLIDLSPDVLHVHSRVPAWLVLLANRPLRIPVVTTVHGFNHVGRYSKIMTWGDRIICVSNPIKQYIQENYSTEESRISVIPCGVNPVDFDPSKIDQGWIHEFKEQFGLQNKQVITTVGRISRSKDYETFLRGIAICAKNNPNLQGLIVGSERRNNQKYRTQLSILARHLGIEDRIVFAGNQSQLPEIYSLSDAVVSSSKNPETFGLTLIESMAMNTPVIASRHGGPLDIIDDGENGYLFVPGNADDLAEQIGKALAAPQRDLRTKTLHAFSVVMIAKKIEAIYQSLRNRLHIVQILPELNQGGIERGVVEFNRELVKREYQSTVISAGGTQAAQIEADGGRHIQFDVCSKNPLTFPFRVFKLRKILRELDPRSEVGGRKTEDKSQKSEIRSPKSEIGNRQSAMLIHARSRIPAWLCHFANRKLKIPFVTTVHGFNSVSKYSAIMTTGDRVICVSNPVKEYIQKNYGIPDEKITVIHRGIDPEEFDPEKPDQEWIAEFRKNQGLNDKYIVTAVGRITELKDYETFIRAISACAKEIPNICGVIVGGVRHDKQTYYERLQALVRELGAKEQIVFAGSQTRMPEIYALSDVLVSSSKQPESFGRTLIEAMAMNTPVIAPRHGGALDIIEEDKTGFFFSPGNTEELSEKIQTARDRPLPNLRKYVEENFSLDHMIEDELAVYRRLSRRHRHS